MRLLKKMADKLRDEPKWATYHFDASKYPEYPEDFKPHINAVSRIVELQVEIKTLFASQADLDSHQRQNVQQRIMELNNRLKIYEIIRQMQYDVAQIQIHYKRIDSDAHYDS